MPTECDNSCNTCEPCEMKTITVLFEGTVGPICEVDSGTNVNQHHLDSDNGLLYTWDGTVWLLTPNQPNTPWYFLEQREYCFVFWCIINDECCRTLVDFAENCQLFDQLEELNSNKVYQLIGLEPVGLWKCVGTKFDGMTGHTGMNGLMGPIGITGSVGPDGPCGTNGGQLKCLNLIRGCVGTVNNFPLNATLGDLCLDFETGVLYEFIANMWSVVNPSEFPYYFFETTPNNGRIWYVDDSELPIELCDACNMAEGDRVLDSYTNILYVLTLTMNGMCIWIEDSSIDAMAGPTGQQGVTGPQGENTAFGQTGMTGPTGQSGFTGSTGSTGPRGCTGPVGPQGICGQVGTQGPRGSTGPPGPPGSPGSPGISGLIGPTGITGPLGLGLIGSTGPTGSLLRVCETFGNTGGSIDLTSFNFVPSVAIISANNYKRVICLNDEIVLNVPNGLGIVQVVLM